MKMPPWGGILYSGEVALKSMQFGKKNIDLSKPCVMGVLNVTPDSFSDGGRYLHLEDALRQAERMVSEGALFIDVGGESTRPGAPAVGVAEELDRVCPVIEAIVKRFDVVVSIDTSNPQVMQAAVALGAGLINDVRALQRPGAVAEAVAAAVPVCLMHMQGEPQTMQENPHYDDVVNDVARFFESKLQRVQQVGLPPSRILIDPGFGFGKRLQDNLQLMAHLPRLRAFGYPLLIGVSRKRMIGDLTGRPVDQRLPGSLAAAVAAVLSGAAIIRTHDVSATLDAVAVAAALREAGYRV